MLRRFVSQCWNETYRGSISIHLNQKISNKHSLLISFMDHGLENFNTKLTKIQSDDISCKFEKACFILLNISGLTR